MLPLFTERGNVSGSNYNKEAKVIFTIGFLIKHSFSS